ncbi:MAG TPA: DinB family protein [Dinghuibacter sp.]|uniref:DinB family protein n=1 Tax=Dinghuibacter sp. TaxID=2024697 RepID=UPI002C654375|nr:DinB family protein [Dinghuibacter sp.]HTJ10824.1 DinB family protein [Dinghuibacter sp.]
MRYLIALLLLSSLSTTVSAQALTGDDIKKTLIGEWTRAKQYTDEYLSAMPADKYSFKAVDSIRSFAQQMVHLASANYFLMSLAEGKQPPAFLAGAEDRPSALASDSVKTLVDASYDYAIGLLQASDPSTYGAMVVLQTRKVSKFTLFLKAFEHQTHHRGQTTIYIRLLGIRPPAERLF